MDAVDKKDTSGKEYLNKLPKGKAGYIHEGNTEYQCKDCLFFAPDELRCRLHGPADVIQRYGSCIYFISAPPEGGKCLGILNKATSGYEENYAGFSCKRCEYFKWSNHEDEEDCEKVNRLSPGDDAGGIDHDGCCNLWTKDPERGEIPGMKFVFDKLKNKTHLK